MAKAKPIPDGFNTVSAYIVVPKATVAMEFYAKAFGAEPGMRMPGPDGESTMHAEMRIGDSMVMLTDENPEWNMKAPKTLGGSPQSLHIYVEDADAAYERAISAGCTPVFPLNDTFWGDRYAKVEDPFGHHWGIATHLEDLTPEEIGRRAEEWFKNMGNCSG